MTGSSRRPTTHEKTSGEQFGAGRYEIRLHGHLGTNWAAWFDGLSVTNEGDGITVIRGLIADQAALHCLLQKIRDVGLPLVSVVQVELDRPGDPAPHQKRTLS